MKKTVSELRVIDWSSDVCSSALGPVQHQEPMRVAIVFFFLQGPAFVLIPVVSRLLARVSPTWLITAGFALMGLGAFALTGLDVADPSLTPIIWPAQTRRAPDRDTVGPHVSV